MVRVRHVQVTDDAEAFLRKTNHALQELNRYACVLIKPHAVISVIAYLLQESEHCLHKDCTVPNVRENQLVFIQDFSKSSTNDSFWHILQEAIYQAHVLLLSVCSFMEASEIVDVANNTY